jgi:CRISPR system Cascade subunit CasE
MENSMSYLTQVPTASFESAYSRGLSTHQAIMGLFPTTLPGAVDERRATSNILFMNTDGMVLVRSDIQPTRLPAAAKTREVSVEENPAAGTVVRFRLVANAVNRNSRTKGVKPVTDIDSWVATKLVGALTSVDIVNHTRTVTVSGRSPLQVDVIDGTAVVENAALLTELMQTGVGRAKAYGCGLLLVR